MSGLGFGDLITPLLPVLCRGGIEGIHFGFPKMLDTEGE